MNNEIKELIEELKDSYGIAMPKQEYFGYIKGIEDYIINLQEQLHQASLDIQELTERDIECPSWCDKLTNLQQKVKHYEETQTFGDYVKEVNLLVDYKTRIEKAVEYITNTEDMCYYGKCNDGDLLIEVEEDFKNDLLNILNGRSDE